MKCVRVLIALAAGLACTANAAELRVLAPILENGAPLEKADPGGRLVPVVTQVRSGALYTRLQREVSSGFTAAILAMDEEARRIAGDDVAAPTWLYLSTEDGGFARKGFWLSEGDAQRYVPDPFVDLVVDGASIENGAFEEIFAHEMGHVFLRRLLPGLPAGYSRTPHSSLSITDYPTAFDEGFAAHFQGLVRRLTRNPVLRNQDLGLEFKPFLSYWASNIDRATRIDGMRRNWFVQAQVAPPHEGDSISRRDQSALFDVARLKNANQMFASEGVIATLFYRWLVPGPDERQVLLDRYSRIFRAIRKMNEHELNPDSAVFLDVLERYCEQFPQERDHALALVVDTTYGVTADPGSAPRVESLAAIGRGGDMRGFVSGLESTRTRLAEVHEMVRKSPRMLRAGLGPDLWLLGAPGERTTEGVRPTINLNSAELEDLLQIEGLDRVSAERALSSRRAAGPYRDLADFLTRNRVDSDAARLLEDAARAAREAGTHSRR